MERDVPATYVFKTTRSRAPEWLKRALILTRDPDVRVIILVAPDPVKPAVEDCVSTVDRLPWWRPSFVPVT